jgi:hypothetical protein
MVMQVPNSANTSCWFSESMFQQLMTNKRAAAYHSSCQLNIAFGTSKGELCSLQLISLLLVIVGKLQNKTTALRFVFGVLWKLVGPSIKVLLGCLKSFLR